MLVDVTSNTIDSALQKMFGLDYYLIYDYTYLELGSKDLVFVEKDVKTSLPNFRGTDSEKITQMISYMKRFTYVENQPNPNKLSRIGGNCHAYSLYFKYMANKNGIDCIVVGTETHAYNVVSYEDKLYKIDTVNNVLEEVEDIEEYRQILSNLD